MITTTLNAISNHGLSPSSWSKLLQHLGKTKADDDPLPLVTVLDLNGLDFALWCCRCMPQYNRLWRLFAVYCARRVQHLMTDQRSVAVIDVAEKYANGQATRDELAAAYFAASAAFAAAAPFSAVFAADAAYFAAAAFVSSSCVATYAADAADAAFNAAAADAERLAQSDAFRLLITTGELPK